MKFLYTISVSAAVAFFVIGIGTANAQSDEVALSQVKEYYAGLPVSYIKASPILESKTTKDLDLERFTVGPKSSYVPVGDNQFNAEYGQDLFELDAEAFTKSMGGSDFLDAKVKFYSKLHFDEHSQKHEKPYTYMDGWQTLNHPPIKKTSLPLESYTQLFSAKKALPENSAYFTRQFQDEIDAMTGTELTFGNKLHALFNKESIKEKLRLVKDTKKYLFGAVMLIICDESSEEFVQALIDKAQSGVPVTLMMEGFYSRIVFAKCTNRLKRGGVDVVYMNDKIHPSTFKSFFHAKYWVRDGEEAIIGGQNILKYENLSTGYNMMNRDSDLLVKGPAVTDLLDDYITLWQSHRHRKNMWLEDYREIVNEAKAAQRLAGVRGKEIYAQQLGNPQMRMNGACRMLVQQAYNRNLAISEAYKHYIDAAQNSVLLTGPELGFSEDEIIKPKHKVSDEFAKSMRDAAKRGVPVELIGNGVDGGNGEDMNFFRNAEANNTLSGRMTKAKFWKHMADKNGRKTGKKHRGDFLELQKTPGIRTWTHFNYMHAKQLYLDRIVSSIGSQNFDVPSAERNSEAAAICMDENLSREMEEQLTKDLVNSVPVVSSNELSEHGEETSEPEQSSPDHE